ncbi:unnamed protein product [Darwinula stevensoni]|uniref:SLC12A transporter C-terminal domain-containing protein n=1 Tax=Darwinula stevensoni TaxID=69355 RepID=A0A7R8XEF3_9CRUS|nr:unnamed protein product [Darwinula stevensoni]CAG0889507.1 unnamed protein product [Darwinula stevensoni]
MFMIQWEVALATFGIIMTFYLLVHYRKPEANWGSSTQAQVYSTALKNSHALNKTAEHVKNYRPQLLILSGPPSSRPSLLDFAYLLTKANSLLIVGHVAKGPMKHSERATLIQMGNAWLQRHGIKSFYDIAVSDRFDWGAKSLLQLSGLGKLRPNIILLGFKADWRSCNPSDMLQYFNVIHDAFDNHTAVGILRLQEGLDYSEILDEKVPVGEKETLETKISDISLGKTEAEASSSSVPQVPQTNHLGDETGKKKGGKGEKMKQKKQWLSRMYCGPNGIPLPKTVVENLTRFQQKQKGGRIDVWWLYDDGGLTILLPYILTQRAQFSSASLRVYDYSLAALLSKFRIDYSDVVVVADIQKKATPETHQEFDALIEPFKQQVNETRELGTCTKKIQIAQNNFCRFVL